MALSNLFTRLLRRASRPPQTVRRRPTPLGRVIDTLEERWVPAVFLVSGENGSNNAIQTAINGATAGDVIVVAAGTYDENLIVPAGKDGLRILGAQAGTNATAARGAESIVVPFNNDPSDTGNGTGHLFSVLSNGVTIDGFTLEGVNGGNQAGKGVTNYLVANGTPGTAGNLTVVNNVIRDLQGDGVSLMGSLGGTISRNAIGNYGLQANRTPWSGVFLGDNSIANVTNNAITATANNYGIDVESLSNSPAPSALSNNTIVVAQGGIGIVVNNLFGSPASVGALTVADNVINTTSATALADEPTRGINVFSVSGGIGVALNNNVIGNAATGSFDRGVDLYNVGGNVTLTGGSVAHSTTGLQVDGVDNYYGAPAGNAGSGVTVSNVTIAGTTTGVFVRNLASAQSPLNANIPALPGRIGTPTGNVSVTINDGSVTGGAGGAVSVQADGSQSFYANATLNGNVPFTGALVRTANSTRANIFYNAVVDGTAGNDTLVLTRTAAAAGNVTYVLNGGAAVPLVGVTSFTFNGLGGNDVMNATVPAGGLLLNNGTVAFDGGAGTNTLNLDATHLPVATSPQMPVGPGSNHYYYVANETVRYANTTTVTHLGNAAAVQAFYGPDTADRGTAFNGLNADERFVQAVYLAALGRAGSKAALDSWTAMLVTGSDPAQNAASRQSVAGSIERSAEARDHLVKAWYVAYFGRAAVNNEESFWVNQLTAGGSEEAVLANVLSAATGNFRANNPSETQFIGALYQALLNRTGSVAEIASWDATFTAGGYAAVAKGFLTSNAFRLNQFEGYYDALLHRPGDTAPQGLQGWAGSADDLTTVRTKFEATSEFYVNG